MSNQSRKLLNSKNLHPKHPAKPLYTNLTDKQFLTEVTHQWSQEFVRLRPDIPLLGSPERTLWRNVLESIDGKLFILEKIPSRKYDRKRRIAHTLQQLSVYGLKQIAPYALNVQGEFISLIDHGLWQICPFVEGLKLMRPDYAMEGWRGKKAASFLVAFNDICRRQKMTSPPPFFSIATYCRNLFALMEKNHPDLAVVYRPFMDHLENSFFSKQDHLPVSFCHGDFHPLNIVWGTQSIQAVIDWEFCGVKPELYDLANLLGCLGMEDPRSLWGPFVEALVAGLKTKERFSIESWKALPDLLLAIRFAWLNEWIRKKDLQMIRLEADYMQLLLSQHLFLPFAHLA